MKYLGFLVVTALFFTACLKSTNPPEQPLLYDYLNYLYVQGPDSAKNTDTITFQVRVTGNKACYKLEGWEGVPSGDRQWDVRPVASYPNPKLGDTLACNGVYFKDTTLRVTPKDLGKQVFRFYNTGGLFRADTVVIYQ